MPRAFVTGATGFVGSNLVALLCRRGWEVDGLIRDPSRAAPLERLGATTHLGSLADRPTLVRAMAAADTVFHVAGRVRALSEAQFATDNVEGTRNIVEAAAARSQPPVVVLVSSLAAGGPSHPHQPRSETDEDQPISAYGKSKLAAERIARPYADEVPISIVRPPIIFGPADRASLAIFAGVKRWNLHPVPGYRKFSVSLVHVADLSDAMLRIAQQGTRIAPPNGPAAPGAGLYYVAAERAIPYSQLGKLAAKSLGCLGVALPLPKAVFWIAGGAAEVVGQIRRRPGVLTLDKIREAVAPGWECNDEKIRVELGYKPAASLEQRFAETADWYRQQGWI